MKRFDRDDYLPRLERKDGSEAGSGMELLTRSFERMEQEVGKRLKSGDDKIADLGARLNEVEQKGARRSGGEYGPQSWGEQVINDDEYKAYNGKGSVRVQVKALTSGATSGGALVQPHRDRDPVMLPKRRLTIRDLLSPGDTTSNMIEYVRQTGFTNNARMVTEGEEKPESNLTFEVLNAPVRTLAHWVPVSRQVMDDAAQLSSIIDTELRYGLDRVEELQLLLGDGTGQNLHGLAPQATDFDEDRIGTGDTKIDILHHAITQAEVAELPATGIILNSEDWASINLIKDGEGRYIGAGPFAATARTIWTLPVVATNSMPQGEFMVGAFAGAAQIFDRMESEVLISSEDRDNFIKNMLTVRAEKRLALVVRRPEALIYGAFPGSST